jgi:hypothetical protein
MTNADGNMWDAHVYTGEVEKILTIKASKGFNKKVSCQRQIIMKNKYICILYNRHIRR